MTQTPDDAADALKAIADATKVFADAEKVRADADKVRADIEDARTTQLVDQLTGAVPDLASLAKSSVTFGAGTALREGEAVAVTLAKLAGEISTRVVAANADDLPLFVVSDPGLVAALGACRHLLHEATVIADTLDGATSAAGTAQAADDPGVAGATLLPVAGAGVVVAAVAGKALTQVASLFELDVAVTTGAADVPAYTLQVAVMAALKDKAPSVEIRHETARIATQGSALLTAIERLTTLDVAAVVADARLGALITGLGDPAARLARAEKVAADDKSTAAQREEAARQADQARADARRLARLQQARNDLIAVLQKARSFAERVTTPGAGSTPSPLARALAVEPLADQAADRAVLVLGGARSDTFQVVVKRRVFWPRLQVSTTVAADYVLVHQDRVLAAGHVTASAAYAGLIDDSGTDWKRVTRLSSP